MECFNLVDRVRVRDADSITLPASAHVGCTGTIVNVNPKLPFMRRGEWVEEHMEGILTVKLDTTHPKTGMWSLILPTTDFERI